jgi:uncharacterized protein (DUF488 family)
MCGIIIPENGSSFWKFQFGCYGFMGVLCRRLKMKIFTIGFSGKPAHVFFTTLKNAGVKKIIDVRLYNTSQLAGYAKKQDLEYLLETIVPAKYVHLPIMAPTSNLLDGYKKGTIDWDQYEKRFNELITQRRIEDAITPEQVDKACFLCSEAGPEHCHRRLIVEYLSGKWENVEIFHL